MSEPVCAVCIQPLVLAEDDVRAPATRESAKQKDANATDVFVFACAACGTIEGFPARLDEKKK